MSASTMPVEPTATDWGKQASFIQPRQPAFWLFLLLLAIGGYQTLQEQSLMSQLTQAFALSWVLVLIYGLPVALLVYRLDLFEREPKLMLAAALVWGGVVATGLAAPTNGAWLSILGKVFPAYVARDWGPAIVGPGVEETLKLMGVVTLYLIARDEFDGVLDGFVYGAMVGLGFTVVEDVSYFMQAVIAVPGAVQGITDQTKPVVDMAMIRIVAGGLYSHPLFTGLTSMGFAYLVTRPREPLVKRAVILVLGLVAGVGAHCVWNSPLMQTVLQNDGGAPSVVQWIEYGALKGLPFLLLAVILVIFATRSEEKTFRAIIAGEPDPWIITEQEAHALRNLLSRRNARGDGARRYGPAGKRLAGKLQAAQIQYAMVRSRTGSVDDPAVEAERQKIRGIRAQIAALPPKPVAPTAMPGGAVPAMPVASALPVVPVVPDPTAVAAPAVLGGAVPEVLPGEMPAPQPFPAAQPLPAPQPIADPSAITAAYPLAKPAAPLDAKPTLESKSALLGKMPEAAVVTPAPVAEPLPEAEPAETAVVWQPEPVAEVRPEPEPEPEPEPQPEAEPEPFAAEAAPAIPAPPPDVPVWAPTHLVPPGGMAAWDAPDPSRPPMVGLAERLELVVEARAGAWAQVRAVNGWRGWVDGRRLVEKQ